VLVDEDRVPELEIRLTTLDAGPAVVLFLLHLVDLLPGLFAYVVDVYFARARLNIEGEGVPETPGPDGLVLTRDLRIGAIGVVVGDAAIWFDPEYLAEQVVQPLGV
jgi:hypothetical protein